MSEAKNGCDLAWCDEHVGGYWPSIGGWQLAWAAESTRLVATEAEARAALVAAAEAAGFDVSACRHAQLAKRCTWRPAQHAPLTDEERE